MFDELFNPLYAPIPDSNGYLKRIGLGPVEKTDKKTLDSLVLAHQRSVPFENLDVYDLAAEISLAPAVLYEKIVQRRRGGYCFELNAAFMALLQSVGYECYAVAARVLMNINRFMPLTHRGTIVTIDGVRYFCDVGFGGPSPQGALLLDDPGEQPSGSNVFVIKKGDSKLGTVINRIYEGELETVLSFSETPCDPVDFIALNEYQSQSNASMFKRMRVCNLVTETGAITLSGNVLKIHSDGEPVEKTLETEAELREALKEYYGLDVEFPLRMD
jgi:N-hydroxyarylamine O-acetyltransferase